jgi:hypothetical protein
MSQPTPDGNPQYQPQPYQPQPYQPQPYQPQPYQSGPYPPGPYQSQPHQAQPYPPAAYQPLPVPYADYSPVPRSQPGAFEMVSRAGRLGAALLDNLLFVVTLGIGWLIWSFAVYGRGQTPARQLLGHVAVDATTGQPLGWGRTALRELVLKGIVGYLATTFTCYVYFLVDSLMIFNDRRQTLHDMMASSVIVHRTLR